MSNSNDGPIETTVLMIATVVLGGLIAMVGVRVRSAHAQEGYSRREWQCNRQGMVIQLIEQRLEAGKPRKAVINEIKNRDKYDPVAQQRDVAFVNMVYNAKKKGEMDQVWRHVYDSCVAELGTGD